MCLVSMPSADRSVIGSKRLRNDGWSPASMTEESEMKNRSNLPRSAIVAIDCMTWMVQLVVNAPSMRQPAEWLRVPSTNTPRCIWRWDGDMLLFSLLLQADVPVAHEIRPLAHFGLDLGGKHLGTAADRLDPELGKTVPDTLRGQHRIRLAIDQIDHRF